MTTPEAAASGVHYSNRVYQDRWPETSLANSNIVT